MRHFLPIILIFLQLGLSHRAPNTQLFPEPIHHQYIQDSIQRPIPQHQIQIELYQAHLPYHTIGQTFQINQDHYLVLLNPIHRDKWTLTFLHELVHIKQFKDQRLQYVPSTHQWTWLNRPIDWTLPWSDRPWEQEADLRAIKYLFWYQTTHIVD